jgi:hypothetical protein
MSSPFNASVLNHLAGAITFFDGDELSHAPHQLKELFAIM